MELNYQLKALKILTSLNCFVSSEFMSSFNSLHLKAYDEFSSKIVKLGSFKCCLAFNLQIFAAYKKKKLEFDNHFSVFVYQSAYPG